MIASSTACNTLLVTSMSVKYVLELESAASTPDGDYLGGHSSLYEYMTVHTASCNLNSCGSGISMPAFFFSVLPFRRSGPIFFSLVRDLTSVYPGPLCPVQPKLPL